MIQNKHIRRSRYSFSVQKLSALNLSVFFLKKSGVTTMNEHCKK